MGLLARNPLNINAVAERFPSSRVAISKHLKILTECGLVVVEVKGRERFCAAQPEKLREVAEWVEQYRQFWNEKLDSLERYLGEIQQEKNNEK